MERIPRRGLVVVLALLAGAARADGFQDSAYRRSTLLSVAWEAAVPTAGLRDYVDEPGFRGGTVELRRGVASRLSLGLAATWGWLSQSHSWKSVQYVDASVTGPLYQRVRLAAFRGTGHWYLTRGPLQPYVGVGAGTLSYETYRNVAGSVETGSGWTAVVDPQIGVLWSLGRGLAVHFQAHVLLTRARFYGVEDARWLGIQAGLAGY